MRVSCDLFKNCNNMGDSLYACELGIRIHCLVHSALSSPDLHDIVSRNPNCALNMEYIKEGVPIPGQHK